MTNFRIALTVCASMSVSATGALAAPVFYDVRNDWLGAVSDLLPSGVMTVDLMDDGLNASSVRQELDLPTGIASVRVTGNEADSLDDMYFKHMQSNRVADDGLSSQYVVTTALVLRLTDGTKENSPQGSFAIGPDEYEVVFSEAVHAFSFDFDRAGFSFLPTSPGAYVIVEGVSYNLSYDLSFQSFPSGFFGVTSDRAIESFSIMWTQNGSDTTLVLDNFATIHVSSVPIPASLPLLGGPLALLFAAGYRRRKARR